jgi:LCP family protein required for cell wall assembly
MRHILAKALIIAILVLLIFPLSEIITKKRVIIIDNQSEAAGIGAVLPECCQEPRSTDKRINALFLGMAGEGNNAPNLTDTLIVMSINEKNKEGFLLSIPRDLLVKIPGKNIYTKINALYQEDNLAALENILNEITGLNFDYNIVIDLEGVKKIIDQVGGIDVFVDNDIYDPAFPGPNNSYQVFTLKKGWQHLDGETTLKYIRTRHDATGDFARMSRQQKALMALKDKISSLHPLWNLAVIFDIWKTIQGHFQTNLSITNIKTFWTMAKDIDLEKIKFKTLDPTTELLVPDHFILGNEEAYILKPRAGLNNYSEIREYINQLINNNL